MRAVNTCLTEGTSWNIDVQCRSTEGRVFWARTIGEAIHQNGRIVALQGAFQDITLERAAIDEQVRAQAEQSFVLRTMTDGFFLLDTTLAVHLCERGRRTNAPPRPDGARWREHLGGISASTRHDLRAHLSSRKGNGHLRVLPSVLRAPGSWFHVTVHPAQTGVAVHFRNVTREVGEQRDLRLFKPRSTR